MPPRTLLAGAAVVIAASAALLTGCASGNGNAQNEMVLADLQNGKTQFTSQCGGCHTLEAAGTKGQVGPNLDDAFRGSRDSGFYDSEFYGLVRSWIDLAPQPPAPGAGPTPMPRGLVTGDDARDVAAFVARNAGQSEESEVIPLQPDVAGEDYEYNETAPPAPVEE